MPFKDKEKQKAYLKEYHKRFGTEYKRQYREFQREKQRKLREAIQKRQIDVAAAIFDKKPNLHIFRNSWKNLVLGTQSEIDRRQRKRRK
ncbi:MAG: hypothetical protein ABSB28_01520 [Candidatus Bathyarchaeia archaeon]